MLTEIAKLDEVLNAHAAALGGDFAGYRNHAYRVMNLCLALSPIRADRKKIAIAAAFHDLGIWTAGDVRLHRAVGGVGERASCRVRPSALGAGDRDHDPGAPQAVAIPAASGLAGRAVPEGRPHRRLARRGTVRAAARAHQGSIRPMAERRLSHAARPAVADRLMSHPLSPLPMVRL